MSYTESTEIDAGYYVSLTVSMDTAEELTRATETLQRAAIGLTLEGLFCRVETFKMVPDETSSESTDPDDEEAET